MTNRWKRLASVLLAAVMLFSLLGTGALAAGAGEENAYVAKVGETFYTTLDEAVEQAPEGSTIELLTDCTLNVGFNKSLTFTGTGRILIEKQLTSNGEGWMCFGLYDSSRVLTFDGPGVEVLWMSDGSAPWLMLSLSATLNVTNGATLTFAFDSTTTKTRNAIYMNEGAVLNVTNGSTFQILAVGTGGTAGQGIQLDKTGKSTINVTGNSKFLIDGTNRGYVNSPVIYVEDSEFTVQNCTSNASNGGNFTAVNSTVVYQNNRGHGLSAGSVILKNSNFTSHNNGYYGVYVSGKFLVDGTSVMTVSNNSYGGDFAGMSLTAGVTDGRVEAGAVVTITGNKCSGLSSRGVCTFEEGVKLTITNNINDKGSVSYGGGIYNTKDTANLVLPSDAVIYNNHAVTGGDDIYNTGTITFSQVGENWQLDDCGHLIDGWYVDSGKDTNGDSQPDRWSAHDAPIFVQEYTEFGSAVTGELALKAAHKEYEITVYPEDQTKYTGGSDGDAENIQFPHPIYLVKDENGNVSEASGKTFLVDGEGTYAPEDLFTVKYFNDAGEEITSDESYGDYIARIVLQEEFAGKRITTADGETVVFADGVLRIRYVSDFTEASGNKLTIPAVRYEADNKQQAMAQVESTGKAGVLLPEGTTICLNGKHQYDYPHSATGGIALFFDDLLPEQAGGDNTTYTNMLKEHAKAMGYDMTGLNTMFKYLDLVDKNNADTWVSSSEGSDVFWPYPAGTDQDTVFALLHYLGLHREYRMNGQSLADQVKASQIEQVTITKTDKGIWFHVPESGFSPFVLVWADKEEPTDPSEPTQPTSPSEPTQPTDSSEPTQPTETTKPATDPEGPAQTGDTAPLFLLGTLLLVSAGCLAVIVTKSRRYHA